MSNRHPRPTVSRNPVRLAANPYRGCLSELSVGFTISNASNDGLRGCRRVEICFDRRPGGELRPLCEKDYYRRLHHVCHTCKKFIQGPFITACGKKYHVDHFTCTECRTVFGKNDSYYEHDGRVLCHYHYSLIAAAKCTGCSVPIISKFVESKKNNLNERWHPECYMINKFWNVKLGAPVVLAGGNDKTMTNEELQREQNRSQVKAQHIWSILSAFEESSAACISEMLIQVSNANFKDGVKMAEKFTMHVEILFTAIDRIETHLAQHKDSLGNSLCYASVNRLGYQQEPKSLCRKIIGFFSLLSHTKDHFKSPIGITQNLLSQVTGVAHYLKSLIRIALVGALKLERAYGSRSAVANFLKMLVVHGDKEKAVQWRMLAKLEADIASELCFGCRNAVEEGCLRYGKHRWHGPCLNCSKCGASLASQHESAVFDQLRSRAYCEGCAPFGAEPGFKSIPSLDQYSFLLRLSLRRLYSLLTARAPDDSVLSFDGRKKSSPDGNRNRNNILATPCQSPESQRESDVEELDERDIAIASKSPRRGATRTHRTGSNATSIHNLSMIVHAKKTPSEHAVVEWQQPEGVPATPELAETVAEALSAESVVLPGDSLPASGAKPKSYLCELSALEFFIVQHLAVLSLAPLVERYFGLDELLELIGPRKVSLWSRFKSSLRPKDKKPEGVFGVSLEVLTEKFGVDSRLGASPGLLRIPYFVDSTISVLKLMDMSVEGIFRKNGNIRRLKELAEAIDRDPRAVDLSRDNPVQVAALLKKYLRDLPDPLIPFKLHRLFVLTQKFDDRSTRRKLLHLSCCLLPRANRDTFEALFVFLKWVAGFASDGEAGGSKMDFENLATVITPNILYGKDRDPTKDESLLAIAAVTDILSAPDDFWEVPESVSAILQEVDLIEDGIELSTEDILRRCENYVQYRSAHPHDAPRAPYLVRSELATPRQGGCHRPLLSNSLLVALVVPY
ncbi:Rho-type GTPase activating protein Rga1 [Massospora cicadina]|nr:Rho-type GTPase activating protein Rga1 [Massospora cicadina]